MRLGKLDLNLLVALDALLSECSVSAAADRIHLSQSATSSALGRLREYFDDDLLVLAGRQMALTARAQELVEPVAQVLEQIRNTIAVAKPFDPLVSERTISIIASDYMTEVLLRPTLLALSHEAPGMSFELFAHSDDAVEELQRGRAQILISIETAIRSHLPSQFLFEDPFVLVGWNGNDALSAPITRDLYEQLDHVVVRFGRQRIPSFEEWALRSQAIKRRVQVIAPSFTSVPGFLIGTRRVATMHNKLAQHIAKLLPLTVAPLPFEVPPARLAAQWSRASMNDPAVRWFVDRLRTQAAMVDEEYRPPR